MLITWLKSLKNKIINNKYVKLFIRPFYLFLVFKYALSDFKNYNMVYGSYEITDEQKNEPTTYKNYKNIKLKRVFHDFFKNNFFMTVDIIVFTLKSIKYRLFYPFDDKKRIEYRLKQTNHGFYNSFLDAMKPGNKNIIKIMNSGYRYIWLGIQYWFLALIVSGFVFYYLLVIRLLPFNKIMFEWISLLMFSYWLISGFVFFIKKYQFGKYTSVIQRFWRRSYILFWAIEACLFLAFFYFTCNASAEPFYMYDQIQASKNRLFSWRFFIFKLLPLIALIVFGYILLISVKWLTFSKNVVILFVMTVFLSVTVWLEFYQFFHILNFYGNLYWSYDLDEHTWLLENEPRRTRIVNHYNSVLMILKFWHIVFIFGFWVFFLLRCWETKRIRYPLLSANLQNFTILYLFAWVSMYPWFKFYYRKLLDTPYYWFYSNNRYYGVRLIWNDLKLVYYGLTTSTLWTSFFGFLNRFSKTSFYYWSIFSAENGFYGFRNGLVKSQIIKVLTQ